MAPHSHGEREDLTGEHRLTDGGQIVMAVLFFAVWSADTFYFKQTVFLNACVPWVIRVPFGIILAALSAIMARKGLGIVFGEVRTQPAVIHKGIFKYVRHPVYLSELLLYLGFLFFSFSLAAAAVWLATFIFLHYVSRHEEQLLLSRFGDEYAKYIREVGMWFPKFKGPAR